MNILFLIREINICGGTHKQLLKLLDYATFCNIDFTVVTFQLDYEKTYSGFLKYRKQIISLSPERPWFLKIKGLRKFYKNYVRCYQVLTIKRIARKVDVVNVHDTGMEELFQLFPNKKIYWQINDLPYYPEDQKRASFIDEESAVRAKAAFERALGYVTDITVNVSKNADRLKKYYGRDSHVFYCGIEPVGILRDNDTFNRFSQKRINLLTSGVFFEYRNYETQVKVVESLIKKGYSVVLRIIGDTRLSPSYVRKIEHMIAEKELGDSIFIEGRVDEKRFKRLHEEADFFLFVNIDQSWGLAVFEAMSCGLPVIVSQSVGATEVLQDGVNSVFVEPTNDVAIVGEIEKLVNDTNYYNIISSNASSFAKTMTWDESYCSKMITLMSGNPS